MKKRKNILCGGIILIAFFTLFVLSPLSKYLTSLGVMSVYSGMHERESIMHEKGIALEIPGGNATGEDDWYPFVMTYNPSAEGFSKFIGEANRKLTILYNFPAFDLRWGKGCSRLYDTASPYYNAFYGAYLVTDSLQVAESEQMPFGFEADGSVNLAETGLVPQYDFETLVLRDFGLRQQDMQFDWSVQDIQKDRHFLDYDGWTCVDAELTVNGAFHRADSFKQSYLQYGTPKYDAYEDADFSPVRMYGRVYARYFSQWKTGIFFYVMAPSQQVVEECDREILQKSKLR